MLWLRTVVFTILVPGTELVLLPLVVVVLGLGPRLELGLARYCGLAPISFAVGAGRRPRTTRRASSSSPVCTATSATRSMWGWCWSWSAKQC